MRGALERFMRRYWAGGGGPVGILMGVLFVPLSWTWGLVTALRNRRWDRHGGRRVDGARVISVGNIAAGGTGKTPFTAWLAAELEEHTHPAVLLRGYGGDEGLLHENWNPTVPVAEGADRVALATTQVSSGRDVLLLDDGFQHRRLARDLDIVLVAAADPLPQRLMPWGPYRERDNALRRAHIVIVTRGDETIDACRAVESRVRLAAPDLITACVTFRPSGFVGLDGAAAALPTGDVTVVTGVARPEGVRSAVEDLTGVSVTLVGHGDHHRFRPGELDRVAHSADAVVITEKDAVKLRRLETKAANVLVLAREMVWEWGRDAVWQRVLATSAKGTA